MKFQIIITYTGVLTCMGYFGGYPLLVSSSGGLRFSCCKMLLHILPCMLKLVPIAIALAFVGKDEMERRIERVYNIAIYHIEGGISYK